MQKKKWGKRILFGLGCLLLQLSLNGMAAHAAGTLYESPYVTFSPDGQAWTFGQALPEGTSGGQPVFWYEDGYAFSTGIASSLRELKTGEHYYAVERQGEVPVGRWEVVHPHAECIHGLSSYREYHGISFGNTPCGRPYYSGWIPYCADCGQSISSGLIYGSREATASVNSINTALDIYYLCPSCTHLEQGSPKRAHSCKQISWNRYCVKYDANASRYGNIFSGDTDSSFHMYNNETVFEGHEVTPNTHLTLNGFRIAGYHFTGWNTKPDGSGTSYADGAEILNLTAENYDDDAGTGIIVLYAQWERTETNLEIDPNGGSYDGKKENTVLRQEYGTVYMLKTETVIPPDGYTVNFDTDGGSALPEIKNEFVFEKWSLQKPAGGFLDVSVYLFRGEMNHTDTVKALYARDPVILPTPEKENSSFGGWYLDPECTEPAGDDGDPYLPDGDVTLYAKWVELVLHAKDNYAVYGGKGAADLSWTQADGKDKTYVLYQSTDGVSFSRIYDAEESVTPHATDVTYGFSGGPRTFTVPYSGFYTLTAAGAQGGNYGAFTGGKGGSVTGRFYLTAGEVLTVSVGGRNGHNGGGRASVYGNGGGYTAVSSDRKGTLLIAGGGGGATSAGNGGNGGVENGLFNGNASASGSAGGNGGAGGGGGYRGGKAGEYAVRTVSKNYGYTVEYDQWIDSGNYGGCGLTKDSESSWHFDMDCGTWEEGPDSGGAELTVRKTVATDGAKYLNVRISAGTGTVTGYKNGRATVLGQGRTDISGYDAVSVSVYARIDQDGCGHSTGYAGVETFELTYETAGTAWGGSSYVNTAHALTYGSTAGVQTGNGTASVKALTVGFRDGLKLDAVSAPDLAAPDAVNPDGIEITDAGGMENADAGGNTVTVTWKKPADNGTAYRHKAESYEAGTDKPLCVSNLTKNVLTSGVAGYYCLVDGQAATRVTAVNGAPVQEAELTVTLSGGPQYLHLAASDVAGNVSETTHVRLDGAEAAWELFTEPLQISGTAGGTDNGNVYPAAADGSWYVRADGSTPFLLSFDSYMDGTAREDYQIIYQILDSRVEETGKAQRYLTELPYTLPLSSTAPLDARRFLRRTEGDSVLSGALYAGASRSGNACRNSFYQAFTADAVLHGKTVTVTPGAGADYEGGTVYSDGERDARNALTLIADAEGPVIAGLEVPEGQETIDRGSRTVRLCVTATDGVSGVRELSLEIRNADNFGERTYQADESGMICVDITEADALFTGDFTVTARAADNVGNVSEQACRVTEFALETEVERILEPHDPVFKRGESGILHITVWGYAERVEVEFPEELTAFNPDLDRIYTYEAPLYVQEEGCQFMIPLYAPENENYRITVRAYKGDRQLEDYPSFSTVEVNGSVLDEIRTRLR